MGCTLLTSDSAVVVVASIPNSSSSASIHVEERSVVVESDSVCEGALVKSRPTRSASSETPTHERKVTRGVCRL